MLIATTTPQVRSKGERFVKRQSKPLQLYRDRGALASASKLWMQLEISQKVVPWHSFIYLHTIAYSNVTWHGGMCLKPPQNSEMMVLGLSLSFTVTSFHFLCQTHSRFFMLPENYREPENQICGFKGRTDFQAHPAWQPHPSPRSHNNQTPVATSSSCTGQAPANTSLKCVNN